MAAFGINNRRTNPLPVTWRGAALCDFHSCNPPPEPTRIKLAARAVRSIVASGWRRAPCLVTWRYMRRRLRKIFLYAIVQRGLRTPADTTPLIIAPSSSRALNHSTRSE